MTNDSLMDLMIYDTFCQRKISNEIYRALIQWNLIADWN